MNISTFLTIIIIYIFLFMISYLIDNYEYKIYYFLIIGLATITFLNIYIGIIYYIKLRNEPGIPGPRGPPGDKGPPGSGGKCIINEKCGFSEDDANKIIYKELSKKFDTTEKCLKYQNIENCGNSTEVSRVNKLNKQIDLLKKIGNQGGITKQQFKTKLRGIIFD